MQSEDITLEKLQASHDYWVANYDEKTKSIDKLCVRSAERLGEIDYHLWKDGAQICYEKRSELLVEKSCLENTLRHFIGFVDLEYITGHDLSPESIERSKTRATRA